MSKLFVYFRFSGISKISLLICQGCVCEINYEGVGKILDIQGGPKKTGPFLNVDNFAMVSGRKACDMSKVCKFCLEKSVKLA